MADVKPSDDDGECNEIDRDSMDDDSKLIDGNPMEKWPTRKFFSKIKELEGEKTDEVKMRSREGVLYLYEAKSRAQKDGKTTFDFSRLFVHLIIHILWYPQLCLCFLRSYTEPALIFNIDKINLSFVFKRQV